MQSWKIPMTWEMCGIVAVEAETLAIAMEVAEDENSSIPLPMDASYVDGSWHLSSDDEECVRCYQRILGRSM